MNGATPEDDGAARTAGCIPALSCRARGAPTPAAETLALARHLIGYLIAGMLAALVITLLPADEIPHLLGGAARPMMFLRAAIGGAPLSVGQGEEVPLTHAMLASASPPGRR